MPDDNLPALLDYPGPIPDTPPEGPVTRPADRCDRCCARAYVVAWFATGAPLMFCAHHFREHEPAIRAAARYVSDERHLLTTDHL